MMTTGHGAFFEQYELEPPTNILQNPKRCKSIYSERKKSYSQKGYYDDYLWIPFPFSLCFRTERERGQELTWTTTPLW
jgi:hypothetical protein